MSIVVIGKSSFAAQALHDQWPDLDWTYLTHAEALTNRGWIDHATCVINCAFAPQMRLSAYDPAADIDSILARLITGKPIHYIMASSRLVYGPGPEKFALKESAPRQPINAYGRNKMTIEDSLAAILPKDRLTILRSSNIFGHELNREMFFGRLLTRLKNEKEIVYDMDPQTIRDFFPVWRQIEVLRMIAETPVAGVFNVGSGFGTPCGKIAEWVMEGYGEGKLTVTGNTKSDQFWLDTTKLHTTYPALAKTTPDHLRQDCIECGQWLRSQ